MSGFRKLGHILDEVYTQCPAKVATHCPPHSHCDRDTAKIKTVAIVVEQRTELD